MSTIIGNSSLGVSVVTRTAPPTSGAPTATDTWFVAAVTDAGNDGVPIEVRDILQFESAFGGRSAGNIPLWDALDVFFREGGKRAIVCSGGAGELQTCLDALPQTLGPGQLSAIGFPLDASAATIQALWTHAADNNRFVIGDIPSTTPLDVAALSDYAESVTDDSVGNGALFGPWVQVPPPAGVTGASARFVPASPVIAALCARVDETGNPNQAAAGRWLPLQYVSGFAYPMSMTDRVTLLDAGVNMMGEIYGVLENYGFQTLVTQSQDNPFWQANCARMRMALVSQAMSIGEQYMFRPIDGQGGLSGSFATGLESMLLDYFSVGALYGADPGEAFAVDVGESVNPDESIAQGKLRAVCSVVLTLHAKAVQIELVTIPIGAGGAAGTPPEVGETSIVPPSTLAFPSPTSYPPKGENK